MLDNRSISQLSRQSIRRTCNEWKTSAQLSAANQEIADLRKLLAEVETERDGLGLRLDCALHHLDETVNYIAQPLAMAHEMGIATELPQELVGAVDFLAAYFEQHETIGASSKNNGETPHAQ